MADLSFDKKTVYTVKWVDRVLEISKPTWRQVIDHQKKLAKSSNEIDNAEAMLDFLHSLGLDKEIAEQMDIDQISQIVDKIMPQDKKK